MMIAVGTACRAPTGYNVGIVMSRYDPDIHHRRSIRLSAYDYTQVGAYFVTICTRERVRLFGEIVDGAMRSHDVGVILVDEWSKTADIRPNVTLDAFVVMPNDVHGIIVITDVGATRRVAPMDRGVDADGRATYRVAPNRGTFTSHSAAPSPVPGSIGAIVGQFKSAATKRINA
jgi:putative transposase